MVDDFTGALMRHRGTLLDMHGTNDIADTARIGERTLMYGVENGKITDNRVTLGEDHTTFTSAEIGYSHALSEALSRLADPSQMGHTVIQALWDRLTTEGSVAFNADPEKFFAEASKSVDKWMRSAEGRDALKGMRQELSDAFQRIIVMNDMSSISQQRLDEIKREFDKIAPNATEILNYQLKPFLQRKYDAANKAIESAETAIASMQARMEANTRTIEALEEQARQSGITMSRQQQEAFDKLQELKTEQLRLEQKIADSTANIKSHPFRVQVDSGARNKINPEFKQFEEQLKQADAELKAYRQSFLQDVRDKLEHAKHELSHYDETWLQLGSPIIVDTSRPNYYDKGSVVDRARRSNFNDYYQHYIQGANPGLAHYMGIQFGGSKRFGGRLHGERFFEDLVPRRIVQSSFHCCSSISILRCKILRLCSFSSSVSLSISLENPGLSGTSSNSHS